MEQQKTKQDNDLGQKQMRIVLEREVVEPFILSVCSDIRVSINLTFALVLTKRTEEIVANLPIDEISKLDKRKECVLFLGYFAKIYQSCLFVLGSTDYLGATILMRSLFELLVGISTKENGSMKDRIYSIIFFDEQEKKNLVKTWDLLCSWAHPYGKWEKNICPIYYGSSRVCHPRLFKQSLEYSNKILDFMLTAIVEILHISTTDYSALSSSVSTIIEELPMFNKRLSKKNT